MNTSVNGINLIKSFEGCRLNAYKPIPTEQYWTIGYGHYGPDVAPNQVITQAQAEILLGIDLKKYEQAVITSTPFHLSQNQFDALVSFAYNCGVGNLEKLVNGRTAPQVAESMLKYNKAGGKVLAGLTRRRQAEHDLFIKDIIFPPTGNPYPEPTKNVRLNSKGNEVRWLQYQLNAKGGYNLKVDGIAGNLTIGAVMDWQKKNDLIVDGIAGAMTIGSLK